MEEIRLSLANVPDSTAKFTRLAGEKKATNSFSRERVYPTEGECAVAGGEATLALPAYSLTILTFQLK